MKTVIASRHLAQTKAHDQISPHVSLELNITWARCSGLIVWFIRDELQEEIRMSEKRRSRDE